MTAPDKDAIRAVIALHARKRGFGADPDEIMHCTHARYQKATGSDNKVIYDDWYLAEACAQALEALGGAPQQPYPCRQSKHGHYHLTSHLDTTPAQKQVIPGAVALPHPGT